VRTVKVRGQRSFSRQRDLSLVKGNWQDCPLSIGIIPHKMLFASFWRKDFEQMTEFSLSSPYDGLIGEQVVTI
jgi:hypothetical protein